MSIIGSVWDELYNGRPPWMGYGEDGKPVEQRHLTEEEHQEIMEALPTDEEVSGLMAVLFGEEDTDERMAVVPAADVVEVVRCKDCKWRNTSGCWYHAPGRCAERTDDDFCSDGERKENNA